LVLLAHPDAPDERFPKAALTEVVRTTIQRAVESRPGERIEWLFRALPDVEVDTVVVPVILGGLLDSALGLTSARPVIEIGAAATPEEILFWV
jgi:hypothetical protein